MDKERIAAIIKGIEQNLTDSEERFKDGEVFNDRIRFDAGCMSVFQSINRSIDLAEELISLFRLQIPGSYNDSFDILKKAKIIKESTCEEIKVTEETPQQAGGVCHERRTVHEHAQERNVVPDMPHSVTTLQIVGAAQACSTNRTRCPLLLAATIGSSGVSNPQFVNEETCQIQKPYITRILQYKP